MAGVDRWSEMMTIRAAAQARDFRLARWIAEQSPEPYLLLVDCLTQRLKEKTIRTCFSRQISGETINRLLSAWVYHGRTEDALYLLRVFPRHDYSAFLIFLIRSRSIKQYQSYEYLDVKVDKRPLLYQAWVVGPNPLHAYLHHRFEDNS